MTDIIYTENLKVKANYSKRSFTIRVDKEKHRTNEMPIRDFYNMLKYTAQDWRYFLESDKGAYKNITKTIRNYERRS
jgi:hypothetical protein